jgi:adenylate cyclase
VLTPDAFTRSRKMFEKAIELDPDYADAYAWLSFILFAAGYGMQWDSNPHVLDRAEELARKAVLLDDSNSSAYAILGWVAVYQNRPDQAIADAERAIVLDPNNAFACDALSEISGLAGKYEAQLAYAQRAMRLDPEHPQHFLFEAGIAYNEMGRYREALDTLKGAEANNPWTHVQLIYTYTELGREQDARIEAERVLRLAPKFSLEVLMKTLPGDWNTPDRRHFLNDLRKAGLK